MTAGKWQLGVLTVYPFGLGLALVYVVAIWSGQVEARRSGVSASTWWGLSTGLALMALVGARVAYMVMHGAEGSWLGRGFWQPPVYELKYVGAVIGGLLYVVIVSRWRKKPLWLLLDLWALPWAVALVVAAVLWGAPIEREAAHVLGALPVHIGYFTATFWLANRVYDVAGRTDAKTEPIVVVSIGDAALRLLVMFVGWFFLGTEAHVGWPAHVARAGLGLLGLYVLWHTTSTRQGVVFNHRRGRQPGSRSAGWFVTYGILLFLMIAINVL